MYWIRPALVLAVFLSACTVTDINVPAIGNSGQQLPGKMVWHELLSDTPGETQAFYNGLFGWDFRPLPDERLNYTVIYNQGFVSALGGGIVDQPSDDPRTAVVDDPTADVVGNFPLIFAAKSAALQVDGGSPGIVDPGDYLRYTIQVYNNGAVPATMVRLVDTAPNDTTYVADTLTLNGLPVGQPDNGVFPLEAGIWISSAARPTRVVSRSTSVDSSSSCWRMASNSARASA